MLNEGFNRDKGGKMWELDSVGDKKKASVHNAKRALSELRFTFRGHLMKKPKGERVIYIAPLHEMNGGLYKGGEDFYLVKHRTQLRQLIEEKFEYRPTNKAIDEAVWELAQEALYD